MKKLRLFLVFIITSQLSFSQVGIGTVNPDPSSILHLNSTTAGLLIPRLTHVQKLIIPSPAEGLIIYQTDNDSGFWYYDGTIWRPLRDYYTFSNGLNASGINAKLGGTLIEDTDIDLSDSDLNIKTTSSLSFPGRFSIYGNDREIFQTNLNQSYAHFGGYAYIDGSVDGTTLSTIGGDDFAIDVVAGFQSKTKIGGSSIRLGSVEYLTDGVDEVYLKALAGFHPHEDQTNSYGSSLGDASKKWARVYANDGVIQTSDMRYKTNVKKLEYGLEEILKLNTITYNWKDNKIGNTILKNEEQENKIGLSAQELLYIIPEVVKTHSWVLNDENGNYKLIENEKLGVNYSEIIPILINAIQELHKQIEELKKKE